MFFIGDKVTNKRAKYQIYLGIFERRKLKQGDVPSKRIPVLIL